ncbi:MAG: YIP1 family protein [Halioglobus sp.]|nr:YIP1 family protein [Halioglobus sp.]
MITDPAGFYRTMPREGGYREPVTFTLVMAAIAGGIFALLSIIGLTGAGFGGVVAIIVLPIALLIGGFIAAAVFFVIWKLMGSAQGYQAAYRCVAYSYAIFPAAILISVIPYVGAFVRTLWSIWLLVTASVEVHGRQQRTALIVFGILGVLPLLGSG